MYTLETGFQKIEFFMYNNIKMDMTAMIKKNSLRIQGEYNDCITASVEYTLKSNVIKQIRIDWIENTVILQLLIIDLDEYRYMNNTEFQLFKDIGYFIHGVGGYLKYSTSNMNNWGVIAKIMLYIHKKINLKMLDDICNELQIVFPYFSLCLDYDKEVYERLIKETIDNEEIIYWLKTKALCEKDVYYKFLKNYEQILCDGVDNIVDLEYILKNVTHRRDDCCYLAANIYMTNDNYVKALKCLKGCDSSEMNSLRARIIENIFNIDMGTLESGTSEDLLLQMGQTIQNLINRIN
jgi:hypothetical protein